jgi:hypothetical protein
MKTERRFDWKYFAAMQDGEDVVIASRTGRSNQSENSWATGKTDISCCNPKTLWKLGTDAWARERDHSRSLTFRAKIAPKLDYLSLANNSLKRGSSRKMS